MHSYYKEKKDIKKGRYLCRTLYISETSDIQQIGNLRYIELAFLYQLRVYFVVHV